MITLKPYQHRVLQSIQDFCKDAKKTGDISGAFARVTVQQQLRVPYHDAFGDETGLNSMPYVCIRVPTGGGKTLLACHAAGIAMKDFCHLDRAIILWLVPSTTILEQTREALQNPRHAYHQALREQFGDTEVITIEEALHLRPATVRGGTVVIVSTIQCFRIEDTTGRKVYDPQNGDMSEHFYGLTPAELAHVEYTGKIPTNSLANVLRLSRPIVVVDEAHTARTDKTFMMIKRLLPRCILEFTATPLKEGIRSNILHTVSASELKVDKMIKLPIRVVTRHTSQRDELLSEAVALRNDLEKLATAEAQATGEYIRPILLIQAERVADCEGLRTKLTEEFSDITTDEVKISTGKLDELAAEKKIGTPQSSVRYIITVEKLREGWDCPFAYVLCSLQNSHSAVQIEQIVGRILRLPSVTEKRNQALNCGYVFAVSKDGQIFDILKELRLALVANGFTGEEAEQSVELAPQQILPIGSHVATVTLEKKQDANFTLLKQQKAILEGKMQLDAMNGSITVLTTVSEREEEAVLDCVRNEKARAQLKTVISTIRSQELQGGNPQLFVQGSLSQRASWKVPRLCVQDNQMVMEFGPTHLMDHLWKLSEKDASLPTYDPLKRPTGEAGEVDVTETGKVSEKALGAQADIVGTLHQHTLGLPGEEWTVESLVLWLDSRIPHGDIVSDESLAFIHKAVRGLLARDGIGDIGVLALDRHRLADALEARIDEHRREERKQVFQDFLRDESTLIVSDQWSQDWSNTIYAPSQWYEGAFQFQKHYYGPKPGELVEGTEEFTCAQLLDGLPEVAYWVRNLVRKQGSFRLQTSRDFFYPDFVCLLTDGRILAVEYKGGNADEEWSATPDSEEKRIIGALWEKRSNGKCLFIMPKGKDWGAIREKIIPESRLPSSLSKHG